MLKLTLESSHFFAVFEGMNDLLEQEVILFINVII